MKLCKSDLVFLLHKSPVILFEMIIEDMSCRSNKQEVLKAIVKAEELIKRMSKAGKNTSSQLDSVLSF